MFLSRSYVAKLKWAPKHLSTTSGRNAFWSTNTVAIKFAMKWLKSSDFHVVPNDKEGTFALISTSDLRSMLEEQMAANCAYQEVETHLAELDSNLRACSSIARSKHWTEHERWLLRTSLRCSPKAMKCRLKYTFKSACSSFGRLTRRGNRRRQIHKSRRRKLLYEWPAQDNH